MDDWKSGKTIVDRFPEKEYRCWKDEKMILLTAGTGTGKTHFIVSAMAKDEEFSEKKILYLVNRTRLLNEVIRRTESEKANNIQIMTYQQLEKHYFEIDLNAYSYIICDECHYFVADSTFNDWVYLSFDSILKSTACKVFLSATPQALFRLLITEEMDLKYDEYGNLKYNEVRNIEINGEILQSKTFYSQKTSTQLLSGKRHMKTSNFLQKQYEIDELLFYCDIPPMNERIKIVHIYPNDAWLEQYLEEKVFPKKIKVLMFVSTIATTEKHKGLLGWEKYLQSKGKSVQIATSMGATNSEIRKRISDVEETTRLLLDNKRFDADFLVATKAIDNGIDIIDDELKFIICDIGEINTMTVEQCIGRKRLNDNESITVLIRDKDVKDIQVRKREISSIETEYKRLTKMDDTPYDFVKIKKNNLLKCSRFFYEKNDKKLVVYEDPLKMAYWEYESECCDISYTWTVCQGLRLSKEKVYNVVEERKKKEKAEKTYRLHEILSTNTNKLLLDDNKNTIKAELKHLTGFSQLDKINNCIEECGLFYKIIPQKTTGGKRGWRIKERRDEWYCIESAVQDIKKMAIFPNELKIYRPNVDAFYKYANDEYYFYGEALMKENGGDKSMYDWIGFAMKNGDEYMYKNVIIVGLQGTLMKNLEEILKP